jgi:hypothetical protein
MSGGNREMGNYWGTATHFRMAAHVLTEVHELVRKGYRIAAIKLIRTHTGCSLAEGKAAVERIEGHLPDGPRLLPFLDIKSMVINTGAGDVTVDLEGLQLMGLMNLERLGLDECRRILDLVQRIEDWQAGTKISKESAL